MSRFVFFCAEYSYLTFIAIGGYELANVENVEYLKELQDLATSYDFKWRTIWSGDAPVSIKNEQIVFMPSFSEKQRNALLQRTVCVLYTPSGEHFGLVPIEAMYSRVPVIAVESGGPKETIIHGKTGYLAQPKPEEFAKYIQAIVKPENSDRKKAATDMGLDAHEHVAKNFSLEIFGTRFEKLIMSPATGIL